MRLFLAFAVLLAAFAARAETLPPLHDKPPPAVSFKPNPDWRLSAVVHYEVAGNVTTLIVEGDIINDTKDERATPGVRIGLRDAAGRELFHWTVAPVERRLKPREYSAFDAKLEGPPAGVVSLELAIADPAP